MTVPTPSSENMCAEGSLYTMAGPGEKKIRIIRKRGMCTHNLRMRALLLLGFQIRKDLSATVKRSPRWFPISELKKEECI